jgi:hypothetical protein
MSFDRHSTYTVAITFKGQSTDTVPIQHCALSERSSNTNPTKNRGCSQVQGFAVTAPLDIPFHSTKSKNIIQADNCASRFSRVVCFDSRLSMSRAV